MGILIVLLRYCSDSSKPYFYCLSNTDGANDTVVSTQKNRQCVANDCKNGNTYSCKALSVYYSDLAKISKDSVSVEFFKNVSEKFRTLCREWSILIADKQAYYNTQISQNQLMKIKKFLREHRDIFSIKT